jgi:hypothetical protein
LKRLECVELVRGTDAVRWLVDEYGTLKGRPTNVTISQPDGSELELVGKVVAVRANGNTWHSLTDPDLKAIEAAVTPTAPVNAN